MQHQQVNQTSLNVELYTPSDLIEAARAVMGGIDLDPASSAVANKRVKAKRYFTEDDNGLAQTWTGRVWMNHPWGAKENKCGKTCTKKSCLKRGYHLQQDLPGNHAWTNKLSSSYQSGHVSQALCITYASTSEKWFKVLKSNYAICFLDGRTSFLSPDGRPLNQNTKGCAVTYMGRDISKFHEHFSAFGDVLVPYS
jgi:ParB family chromosome partitioning protein